MKKNKIIKTDNFWKPVEDALNIFHNNVQVINSSKIFAGLMIIILNISSKFVTIRLSKSMESYLKYTFSRQILVFAMAWMGTRDIYVAFFITIMFTIITEYLLNEESMFCCLPSKFREYHISLIENEGNITDEDIKKAQDVLEKAKQQNKLSPSSTTNINTTSDIGSTFK